jgi:hypothetical protein
MKVRHLGLNGEISVGKFDPGKDIVYFDEEFDGRGRISLYHRKGGLYYVVEYTKGTVISERAKDKFGEWHEVPKHNSSVHALHTCN